MRAQEQPALDDDPDGDHGQRAQGPEDPGGSGTKQHLLDEVCGSSRCAPLRRARRALRRAGSRRELLQVGLGGAFQVAGGPDPLEREHAQVGGILGHRIVRVLGEEAGEGHRRLRVVSVAQRRRRGAERPSGSLALGAAGECTDEVGVPTAAERDRSFSRGGLRASARRGRGAVADRTSAAASGLRLLDGQTSPAPIRRKSAAQSKGDLPFFHRDARGPVPSALTVNVVPMSSSSPSGSRTSSGRSRRPIDVDPEGPRRRATSSRPPGPAVSTRTRRCRPGWWRGRQAPAHRRGAPAPKTTIAPSSAAAVSGQSNRRAARDVLFGETSERSKAASRRVRSRRRADVDGLGRRRARPQPPPPAGPARPPLASDGAGIRCRWKLFRAEPSSRPSRKAAT